MATDKSLKLDVFAYDLNEPDLLQALLKLAGQGRIRMILDSSTLHHNTTTPKPEATAVSGTGAGDNAAALSQGADLFKAGKYKEADDVFTKRDRKRAR